ncbi:MAG: tetratricopeptide repeat protein [Microscillaceae bacterium]|jgi:serine phosphatase RsbU (regulator of sigma subunit)/tetratricopeptide (TPR) repeat protein|nr:tetratricopeptide repeat protein [Microscillaceae bacterium]
MILRITRLVVLLNLWVWGLCQIGQAQELNPQVVLLKQAQEDTNKVKLLNQIAEQELSQNKSDKALEYAQEAYKLALNLNYKKGKAESALSLGKVYRQKSNYTTALNYFLEANQDFQKQTDWQNTAIAQGEIALLYQLQRADDKAIDYFNLALQTLPATASDKLRMAYLQGLGNSYFNQKKYDAAIDQYQKTLDYHKKNNDNRLIINILDKIGSINVAATNYDSAIDNYEEIIKVNQKLNDAVSLAAALNNLGYLYKQNNDNQKSLKTFRQALTLNQQLYSAQASQELKRRNAVMASNIGVTYANMQNYREARKYFNEAKAIYEAQNNPEGMGKSYNYLAATYFVSGNNELSATNAFQAVEYGKKANSNDVLLNAYKILAEVFQRNSDFKEAQVYYKLYLDLKEDQAEKQRKKEQEILQNQIDIERKENELKTIQADKELQALTLNQLRLEKERQEQDIALKAKELEILRSNQEKQTIALKNQALEKENVQRLLEATKQRAETEKQKQEIAMLEQTKKLQDLTLKQKAAEEKERQKERELLEKENKLKEQRLKDGEVIQRYGVGLLALLAVILALILFGFMQSRKARRALAQQNAEIQAQKTLVEQQKEEMEVVNRKLKSNEQILQKAYDRVKQSEQQIKEKNEELQASEEELRQNMEELEANKEEIEAQKEALQVAYKSIEEKNLVFTHSIKYAEKIQQAILPNEFEFKQVFPEHFVIFRPKDIVSGDFYWLTKLQHKTFIACVDCTGHGVPGAFMSLIGNSLLHEIISEKKIFEPHKILEVLHIEVQKSLRQKENNGIDGMDMVVCVLEEWEGGLFSLQFSGAKNSVLYYSQGELHELLGDRKAIGGFQSETYREFSKHTIKLQKGDILYLTTDGYTDAPNQARKKFGEKRLKELLKEIATKPIRAQETILTEALDTHHNGSLQRDDITFMGLKL